MKKTKLFLNLFSLLSVLSLNLASGCAQQPLLSELVNSRMTLLLKGTYESNNGYAWATNVWDDDAITAAGLTTAANSNVALTSSSLKSYYDIAEIRIAKGTGQPANTMPSQYWQLFSRNRTMLCTDTIALYSKTLDTCANSSGVQNLADFYGNGLVISSSDVKVDTYNHLGIYFRKMITAPAAIYDLNNVFLSQPTVTFDNRKITAFNTGEVYYYASGEASPTTPRIFPLQSISQSLTIPPGDTPYVLEVRVFLKNLMMRHVVEKNGQRTVFIGPSDWKSNHAYNTAEAGKLGDNLIFTSRIYDPATVGNIAITTDAGTSLSATPYYAVMPAGSTFDPMTQLPLAATQKTLPATISNLPPGQYDLYKTCDLKWNTSTGLTTAQDKDGYPETAALCQGTVNVTAGQTTTVPALNCGC